MIEYMSIAYIEMLFKQQNAIYFNIHIEVHAVYYMQLQKLQRFKTLNWDVLQNCQIGTFLVDMEMLFGKGNGMPHTLC